MERKIIKKISHSYLQLRKRVIIIFVILYLIVFFFFPVTIDTVYVPTLVNGITASVSIIIGFGGAITGIVFHGYFEKGNSEAKKTYLRILGLFLISLVYQLGTYTFLTTGQFGYAVRVSLDGYLVALFSLFIVYISIAQMWDLEEEKKSERPESDKPKPDENNLEKKLNQESKIVQKPSKVLERLEE